MKVEAEAKTDQADYVFVDEGDTGSENEDEDGWALIEKH